MGSRLAAACIVRPERWPSSALLGLAEANNAFGDHEQALEYTQRVHDLLGEGGDPGHRADAHLSAAEAHLGLGQLERAREEALAAREGFGAAEGRYVSEQGEAEALIAQISAKLDG